MFVYFFEKINLNNIYQKINYIQKCLNLTCSNKNIIKKN